MGGGWFPKLVWPKHNMVNQQVKVGVVNNDKSQTAKHGTFDEISLVRGRPRWCGFGADFAEVVRIWSGAVRIYCGAVRKWRVATGADVGSAKPNLRWCNRDSSDKGWL